MFSPVVPQTPDFQKVGVYRNLGGVPNALVGPGPTPGSQRYYQSYMYVENTLEVVAVDPATGTCQVYENPAPSETGAWAMTVGDDGNIYVGTLPHAHLLRLDPRQGTFVDLGRPSATEQYIWNLSVGTDHKIYGCTFPSAKLVRYDPATGKSEDLGRMDPKEQYARHIAAGSDGYVYIGIGTSHMNIAAYNIATGAHQEILPAEYQKTGTATVYRAVDGQVYADAGGHFFRLSGGAATLVEGTTAPAPAPKNRLLDGRTISIADHTVIVTNPSTSAEERHPYPYTGRPLTVYRLGEGPDGRIYGSSVLPLYLFRLDPATSKIHTYGLVGGGESYSILTHGDQVLIANYSGDSPLMVFDPTKPYKRGLGKHAADHDVNPLHVTYPGAEGSWRPMAMINGDGNQVYVGAVSAYGLLGGPLAVWDTKTNHVQAFDNLIPDESVVSLAYDKGLLYGGTTIGGGGGAHTTQTDATLFIWDPNTQKVVFQTRPVPGAGSITSLIIVGDKLYGFARDTFFVFDTQKRAIVKTEPFHGPVYNSAAIGPDGAIWGLSGDGIYTIDPKSDTIRFVAKSPEPIYGGFVLKGYDIYFSCAATIYRYRIPSEGKNAP